MLKKNWKWCWFIGVMVIFFMVAGCGTSIKSAMYSSLKTIAEMHNSSVIVVFDLHQKQIIKDEKVNEFLNLSDKVQAAYDAAQAAFEIYMAVDSAENAEKLKIAVAGLQASISVFTNFYTVIVKGE